MKNRAKNETTKKVKFSEYSQQIIFSHSGDIKTNAHDAEGNVAAVKTKEHDGITFPFNIINNLMATLFNQSLSIEDRVTQVNAKLGESNQDQLIELVTALKEITARVRLTKPPPRSESTKHVAIKSTPLLLQAAGLGIKLQYGHSKSIEWLTKQTQIIINALKGEDQRATIASQL